MLCCVFTGDYCLGCRRFQRHRVQCLDETGGGSWNDENSGKRSSWKLAVSPRTWGNGGASLAGFGRSWQRAAPMGADEAELAQLRREVSKIKAG